jgi:predicted ArsR family transcriptional regulator
VEIRRSDEPAAGLRLGPRPASRRDAAPRLSASRAELLERLHSLAEPISLAGLTAATGLHSNTVREHLDALVHQGLVRRYRAAPRGRGRPAWLYEAVDVEPTAGSTDYAGLATTLAAAIHRSSSSPRADAVAAGMDWGRDLARDRGSRDRGSRPGGSDSEPRRRVVALLADLGFAPEAEDERSDVLLTRCPLLEAASRHTDVVCGVHLGIVRGALAEFGAGSIGSDLVPFAEPGACVLRLSPGREPAAR